MPVSDARATAVAGGCWPYGVGQPGPTATPLVQPTPDPALPPADPPPAMVIYPTCVPGPLTPTLTPEPTHPPTPHPLSTQIPAGSVLAGESEVGDFAGAVDARGLAWAWNPRTNTPVIAFISYASSPNIYGDGQVWVRAMDRNGHWGQAQTLNPAPVTQFYGSVELAVTPDGHAIAVYGTGNPKSDATIWVVESEDGGHTWGPSISLGHTGAAYDLKADGEGGLHLLINTPEVFRSSAVYGYRAPGGTSWQWSTIDGAQWYTGEITVLPVAGGLRRLAVLTTDRPSARLIIVRSDDGVTWSHVPFQYDRWLPESNPTIRPSIIAVPRGDGLVAVAWSCYGAGGVFATVSQDGGQSFSPAERIGMEATDGAISDDWGYGTHPSLVYDARSDMLVALWVEVQTGSEIWPAPLRTYLAARSLDATPGDDWMYARTPQNLDSFTPPQISTTRTLLYGSADGWHHMFVSIDERNMQYRVTTQPILISGLLPINPS